MRCFLVKFSTEESKFFNHRCEILKMEVVDVENNIWLYCVSEDEKGSFDIALWENEVVIFYDIIDDNFEIKLKEMRNRCEKK